MEFSWKRIGQVVGLILLILAAAAGIYFFANWRPVKIAWASMVYDRREIYWNCDDLPFYPEVQKALTQHSDIIQKMQQAGAASVTAEKINCPNSDGSMYFIKGDMLMTYQNRAARSAAEKVIGDNFFGIPYRGQPTN